MDPAAARRFLTEVAEAERRKYVDQVRITVGFAVAGLALVTAGSAFTGVLLAEYWKWLLTLGGGFVGALPAVRLNELYTAKVRHGALLQLRADFERATAPLSDVPPAEVAKLAERVDKLFDKTLGL